MPDWQWVRPVVVRHGMVAETLKTTSRGLYHLNNARRSKCHKSFLDNDLQRIVRVSYVKKLDLYKPRVLGGRGEK